MTTEMTVLYMLCFLILTSKGKKEKKKKKIYPVHFRESCSADGKSYAKDDKEQKGSSDAHENAGRLLIKPFCTEIAKL